MLDRLLKAANKLREITRKIELESASSKKLSFYAKDIHVKTQEVSQNIDIDMQEILGIVKSLQAIQSGQKSNTTNVSEIRWIEEDRKKLKQLEDDPICSG